MNEKEPSSPAGGNPVRNSNGNRHGRGGYRRPNNRRNNATPSHTNEELTPVANPNDTGRNRKPRTKIKTPLPIQAESESHAKPKAGGFLGWITRGIQKLVTPGEMEPVGPEKINPVDAEKNPWNNSRGRGPKKRKTREKIDAPRMDNKGGTPGTAEGAEAKSAPDQATNNEAKISARQAQENRISELLAAANPAHKTLVINVDALETRVALMGEKRLQDYQVERNDDHGISGAIFLGRICNLENSLEAAFVDIGLEKNAFLHFKDMMPVSYDAAERIQRDPPSETPGKPKQYNAAIQKRLKAIIDARKVAEAESPNTRKRRTGKLTQAEIPQLFPPSSSVLVQVSKGPIGTKGPRVTTNISLPGRYLVLLPYSDHIGISQKIENRNERNRLRQILSSFDLPPGVGLICRTNGEGHKKEHFENDLALLLEIWANIEQALLKPKPPVKLYAEPNLLARTLRDSMTEDIDAVYIDDRTAYNQLKTQIEQITADSGGASNLKIYFHDRPEPIFNTHGVSSQLEKIFDIQAPLPSGGYLCIEETEALVSIDVNSGKNRSGKDLPETIFKTNIEAACEIARQSRLRNIGGLIVVDFIDMPTDRQRQELYQVMKRLFQMDRVKSEIAPLSRFGLMEMTRQREEKSLLNTMFHTCPYCAGRGRVRSVRSMTVEIHRHLSEMLRQFSTDLPNEIRVYMHSSVLEQMKKEDANILNALETEFNRRFTFRPDDTLHLEKFRVVNPENEREIMADLTARKNA